MHSLEQQVEAGWPADWREVGTVLAVSGGADSVALLRATARLASTPRLLVAHFNHHLRGEESEGDERFVVELCARLGCECQVGHAEPGEKSEPADRAEAAARLARYQFLQKTAEQAGARYVATAHTADDQAETILHHVLRGTGLSGLAGIPRVRPMGPAVTVVRPMLDVSRADVLAYLVALEQPHREDHTNAESRYMRNRIRHELLPLLKRDYSAAVVQSLVRLGTLAGDAQRVIDEQARQLLERSLLATAEGHAALDCQQFAAADRHLVREMLLVFWRRQGWPLQPMGFCEWDALAELALGVAGPGNPRQRSRVFPGAITVERRDDQLVFIPAARKQS